MPPFWQIGQGGHFCLLISLKNTNLVGDLGVEINLLPYKFRWILFSDFREINKNVSANERPEWPSYFSDMPENHKLGRACWDLASYKVLLNSIWWFQGEVIEVSANWKPGPHCFSNPPENHKLCSLREHWDHVSRQVPWSWTFSGFKGEVENFSANQRTRWPSCFSNRPVKHQTL